MRSRQAHTEVGATGMAVPVGAKGMALPVGAIGMAVPVGATGMAAPVGAKGMAVPVGATVIQCRPKIFARISDINLRAPPPKKVHLFPVSPAPEVPP